MQTDLHYYGTAVLARAAGYPPKEALTIAYAAQYVDDATEGDPITVDGVQFDPVRTAHYRLSAFTWSVQKRIYIPFHFLPAKAVTLPSDSFVTEAGSAFGDELVAAACKERRKLLRLCRIGIAIHTYADTWSHQGFSGRKNAWNDVTGIHHWIDDAWDHLFWANIGLDVFPTIGHVQAGSFPDIPYLKWKYTNDFTNEEIERPNPDDFLAACRAIHGKLRAAKKAKSVPGVPWTTLAPQLQAALAHEDGEDARCANWRNTFGHLFGTETFHYDPYAWRNEALRPAHSDDVEWDKFEREEFDALEFHPGDGFWDSAWVQFHRAALRQRHYVLEHLI